MAKIYTKTGDQGQTSLLNGQRVDKNHQLIELYGQLDELNSYLGLIISQMLNFDEDKLLLIQIQKNLFQVSSFISCPVQDRGRFKLEDIDLNQTLELEKRIDLITAVLPELKNFILPGGTQLSSFIHLARTKCRTIERSTISQNTQSNVTIYLNRLSDYLFTLSRFVNFKNEVVETIWP